MSRPPPGNSLRDSLEALSTRQLILFGGKGGVGKTTIAAAAALHYAASRPVILFTTDPASNLGDLFGPADLPPQLTLEPVDAEKLYQRFLGEHLERFLEIGDRGTYLDRQELRRLFELSLPGVDELMAWMHIGELAEEHPRSAIIVDTAPTGHTLRMLSASEHFQQLARALDAMQEKHRVMVRQFTRRDVKDAVDAFIEDFDARARRRRDLLADPARAAFVPVLLSEPLVVDQTLRLIAEVGIDVPFVILNRFSGSERDEAAKKRFVRVVEAPRACVPLDSAERLRQWLDGTTSVPRLASEIEPKTEPVRQTIAGACRLTFLAGKGGVGKTSCATSVALQLARRNRSLRYVVISVDPAHSLADVFSAEQPPTNLTVETIDTKAQWRAFRENVGRRIEEAVDALTPGGLSIEHDTEAMRQLVEIAPPGADELFAIIRLADLIADESVAGIIVDTAPTGHFLRLLDLPRAAGDWVREFMRLLLRYKELVPAGELGEQLVRASRSLKELDEALHSDQAAVLVVTRPERIVVAETKRLLADLDRRGIRVAGVVANYVTPLNDDPCDQSMRSYELAALAALGDAILVERLTSPPATLGELEQLVELGV